MDIEFLFPNVLTYMFLERLQNNFAKARENIGENESVKCSTVRKKWKKNSGLSEKEASKISSRSF